MCLLFIILFKSKEIAQTGKNPDALRVMMFLMILFLSDVKLDASPYGIQGAGGRSKRIEQRI